MTTEATPGNARLNDELGPNAQDDARDPHRGGSSCEASMLRNLLARIHRDGGHYGRKHGLDKALADADSQVVRWLAVQDELAAAPVAIMDTREALSLCAPTEDDFTALYALQGHRVALVDLGPNEATATAAFISAADPQTVSALLAERDTMRALLAEWDDGMYDSRDFLRRVRLVLHGDAGLQAVPVGPNV